MAAVALKQAQAVSVFEDEPGVLGHKGERQIRHRFLRLDGELAVRSVGEDVRLMGVTVGVQRFSMSAFGDLQSINQSINRDLPNINPTCVAPYS